MFFRDVYKRLENLEKTVEHIKEVQAVQTRTIGSINEALTSIHKRIMLQQEIITSISKQLNILAEATLLKEAKKAKEVANAKPTMVKGP
jgi:uncharacterized coiled-coil protein SlyX